MQNNEYIKDKNIIVKENLLMNIKEKKKIILLKNRIKNSISLNKNINEIWLAP